MRSKSEIERGIELLEQNKSWMEQSGNPDAYREEIANVNGRIKALNWVLGDALL